MRTTDNATKRAIYNSKIFIPVGGRAGTDSEDEEVDEDAAVEVQEPPTKETQMGDKLPVFHNEYPNVLAAEIINLYSVVGIIDLTAGAGAWAKAAMDAGIHYFGVALTLKRPEELSNHLVEYAKAAQLGTTSPLHGWPDPGAEACPNPEPGPDPPQPPKQQQKIKGKKAKQRGTTGSSSSESDSSLSPTGE